MKVIEINKNLIPYSFDISLNGVKFTIGVNYNYYGDFFTLSLRKNNELVCAGEPLVYGSPLWADMYKAEMFPMVTIIPTDISGDTKAVTFDNLGETVFLYIDNGELTDNE